MRNQILRFAGVVLIGLSASGAQAVEQETGAWEKSKRYGSETWIATKKTSKNAWKATKQKSGEIWDATMKMSSEAWEKTKGMVESSDETDTEKPPQGVPASEI